MNYDEFYKLLLNKLENSIKFNDQNLKSKIYKSLVNWYKNEFEEILIKSFKDNDEFEIANTLRKIDNICKLPDYIKLVEITKSKEYDEFYKLSLDIYDKIINYYLVGKEVSKEECEELEKKVVDYEKIIPNILKNKYNEQKSECLLDIEYLKNKGKVDKYSIRFYNFIR